MSDIVRPIDQTDPSVMPICMPKVNWSIFLGALQEKGHPRVTGILDSNGVETEDLPALTLVLSSLFNSESNVVNAVKNAGSLLHHTHVSFLVVADPKIITEISLSLDLAISTKDDVAVFSGTLHQWKTACIEGTSVVRTKGCRQVFNIIVTWLERGALTHMWWGYKKATRIDKTFSLVLS